MGNRPSIRCTLPGSWKKRTLRSNAGGLVLVIPRLIFRRRKVTRHCVPADRVDDNFIQGVRDVELQRFVDIPVSLLGELVVGLYLQRELVLLRVSVLQL